MYKEHALESWVCKVCAVAAALTISAKSFAYKGSALESIFSPASFARWKQMRQMRSFSFLYHACDSVVAPLSRAVKKSLVASVPVAPNLALAMFMREPR